VQYAEPDFTVHLLNDPSDFRYWDNSLWALRNTGNYGGTPGADIKAAQAWDLQTSAANIIVAVTDTGARLTHEDLAANLWTNPGESGRNFLGLDRSTNGLDDDHDGYVDDVHGINAIVGTGLPLDDYGHGSHVSGTLGAVGNNSVGVVGIAWRVQLMECKFIDSSGQGSISDAITCLDYARSKGAKIVNASWGGYTFTSTALYDAINSLRSAGILFIAACGNDNNDNDARPLYPASYNLDNIIAVAATDRTDAKAWFSNYGAHTVQLGAPGQAIFSCWNGTDNDYRSYDGTSMAAPQVSGACALVWAHYPNDSYLQIKNRILSSTDPLPTLVGNTVTGGRLNLYKALTISIGAAGAPGAPAPSPPPSLLPVPLSG
jgi:subtilisin family serine protease